MVPNMQKKIENAGKGYAVLQGKFFRAKQRNDIAAGNDTDKKGRKIQVADSESEDEASNESPEKKEEKDGEDDKYAGKSKKKTKD